MGLPHHQEDPLIVYFSVDVEASGPVPGLYNLVSIGAVPVVGEAGRWRPADDRFYVELRPVVAGFDPGAMAVHGISRRHLEQHGVEAGEAMRRLTAFVEERARGARAVFVGHNVGFDWSYVSYYYAACGLPNPFGYKSLDIKSLAMGRLGIDWFETSKENLEKHLPGVPAQDASQTHRADYDALYQAWLLCALLNRAPGAAA
ncbi:MAG: 3'-5' exonuclease [Candidatus Polarisedimenticolia bacterium]